VSNQERHREPSLADQVYDRLVQGIMDGQYLLNARLPSEEALSRSVGVSRPVLRAALARLRDDGLVNSRRGSGNYVVRRPDRSVIDFVPLSSISDIQRCYEFRIDIESAAAAWAARKRDSADVERLQIDHEQMQHSYRVGSLGVDEDRRFHLDIARATKNRFYISMMESLAAQIQFGMRLSRSLTLQAAPERNGLVQAEHQAILLAIIAQDADAAAAAMSRHISAARDRMFDGGHATD